MIRLRILGGKLAAVCGAVALLVPSLPAQALTSDGQSRINTVAEDKSTPCQIGTTAMVAQAPNVISLLGIKKAWQLSRGSKVKVAIVDSGVVASNVHLTENVLPGIDLVDSGDGRTDAAGHGTAIAGQIAAHEVEGSGLVGLAPEAEILPVRVYVSEQHDATSAGKGPDGARTAKGIVWAADQGAKVIVVAQSSPTDLPELKAAVEHAAASGALVVASAGNVPQDQQNRTEDPKAPRYPAAYPQALSVTAVDANGAPSDSVLHGEHVEVAAPGSQVLSTFFGDGDCMFAGNQPKSLISPSPIPGRPPTSRPRNPWSRKRQRSPLGKVTSSMTSSHSIRSTSTSMQASSRASRTTVSAGFSPGSTIPEIAAQLPSSARRPSSTSGPASPSRSTTRLAPLSHSVSFPM